MNEKRGPWYLLTGVVIGIVLGVLVGWAIPPGQDANTTPATLRSDFKDEYRYMIAAAYSATGNLVRARARLALLTDADSVKALGDQAQRMLANNTAPEVVRSLADLSEALHGGSNSTPLSASPQPATPPGEAATPPAAPPTNLPSTSSPAQADTPAAGITPTLEDLSATLPAPVSTAAPRPTHIPTTTPGAPFELIKESEFCEATQAGLLQVSLQDSSGQPAAGIELVITWLGGEEHFFTGLKPELGNGYADFKMTPDVEYALNLSSGGQRVTALSSTACTAPDGTSAYSGIRLEFKQP